MPKYLTASEYAAKHGVTVGCVRKKLILYGIDGAKRIELPGRPRKNDHVWIIPEDAPYVRRVGGRKKGDSDAARIAREHSDGV